MYQVPEIVEQEIEYPGSDGEPMAETGIHVTQMIDALIHPLKERFRDDPDVYVSANMFLYYEEGNPRAVVAPDVFVVFGVPDELRRTYKVWEEGKAPDVIFELTSKKTVQVDLVDKKALYERLGVREYFLFDPLRDYLHPPLQGFRREGERYVPLLPDWLGEEEWELRSAVLGLILRTEGATLRFYDPEGGRYLLTRPEESEARRAAEKRAADAEAEIARLRALLEQQQEEGE